MTEVDQNFTASLKEIFFTNISSILRRSISCVIFSGISCLRIHFGNPHTQIKLRALTKSMNI